MLPPSVAAIAVPRFHRNVKTQARAPPKLELLAIMDPVWELSSKQKGGGSANGKVAG